MTLPVDGLVANALHGTLLLALAWSVDRLLARRAPHVVLAVWCAALLRLVLPPTLWSPFSVGAWLDAAGAPSSGGGSAATAGAGLPVGLSGLAWTGVSVWLAGTAGMLLVAARRRRAAVRRLVDRRRDPPSWLARAVVVAARRAGLRALPDVLVTDGARVACVLPGRRVRIALPTGLLDDRRAVRHVLLHECLHVRRRDGWVRGAAQAVRALWWFHPLVWVAAGRIAALQEVLCDGDVARCLGARARAYRTTLLRLAAQAAGVRPAPPGPGFLAAGSLTLERARWLAGRRWSASRGRRGLGLVAVALVSACVLPLAPPPAEASRDGVETRASARLPDDALALARQKLARHAAGESEPGCLQLRYAALLVAAHEGRDGAAASSPKGNDRP